MLRIYDKSKKLTTVLWDSVSEPEARINSDGGKIE